MKKILSLLVLISFVLSSGCAIWKDKPENQEPQASTGIDLSNAVWYKVDGKKAQVTGDLSDLTFDGKNIYYSISKDTESWTPSSGEKNCNQYSCFFVKRNGQYMGGKFDWSTYSRKWRPVENIRSGYTGGIKPVPGETVWFCFTDLNGTKRTDCESIIWK